MRMRMILEPQDTRGIVDFEFKSHNYKYLYQAMRFIAKRYNVSETTVNNNYYLGKGNIIKKTKERIAVLKIRKIEIEEKIKFLKESLRQTAKESGEE